MKLARSKKIDLTDRKFEHYERSFSSVRDHTYVLERPNKLETIFNSYFFVRVAQSAVLPCSGHYTFGLLSRHNGFPILVRRPSRVRNLYLLFLWLLSMKHYIT